MTKIEWCDEVWNPVTGCTPVSRGCDNCYARRMANRLKGRYGYPKDDPFKVTLHPDRLDKPLHWRKPRRVFVCSMGDLFHEEVPSDFITSVYDVMEAARQHTFIVLTKRPAAIGAVLYERTHYLGGGDYLPNVWHLTSVENQQMADMRVSALLSLRSFAPWPVLGVSYEPALGPVDLRHIQHERLVEIDALTGDHGVRRPLAGRSDAKLSWIIAGGESGPGARPMHPDWVRGLRDQATEAQVPFFFKQWGKWAPITWQERVELEFDPPSCRVGSWNGDRFSPGQCGTHLQNMVRVGKKLAGRMLDGREWNDSPPASLESTETTENDGER